MRFGMGLLCVIYPNPGGAAFSENISKAVRFRSNLKNIQINTGF